MSTQLIPYLSFAGNAEEVLNFYKEALGGEIVLMNRYGKSPMPCDEDYKDKVMHARFVFDGNMIMISDAFKGRPVGFNGNIQLSVVMNDAEKLETTFNKLAEGGKIQMPLQVQFWGDTFGMLLDKFGVSWMFNCEKK